MKDSIQRAVFRVKLSGIIAVMLRFCFYVLILTVAASFWWLLLPTT